MSLLKQDISGKEQTNENAIKLAELNVNDNENNNYKVKAICNNPVYAKKSESGYLSEIYYLIFWKSYLKKKIPRSLYWPLNTLRSSLA